MSSLIIKGGALVLSDGSLGTGDVTVSDGLITGLGDADGAAEAQIDASGCYVLPGLIDIHTHGMGRESFSSESLEEYLRLEASNGCTTFLITLFGPPEESIENMRMHRKNYDELKALPQIAGFRLESPYLSFAGGGASRDIVPIDGKTTSELLDAGGGHIKVWDVSPELNGAPELIGDLSSRGIVCSLAHTYATIEQAKAAVDAGARSVTHLFDAFQVAAETEAGVHPAGLVDYLLVEDRVACEIIADGTHVPPLLIERTLRCKPLDKTIFITDSNYGAGLPPGTFDLPHGWGRAAVDGPNNGVRLVDRGMCLSGSALTPIYALRNCVSLLGKDLATASRLCSTNPAKLLGLNKGEIAVGRDADIIVLDDQLNLLHTIVQGKIVYTA